jgi:hypothetical protein
MLLSTIFSSYCPLCWLAIAENFKIIIKANNYLPHKLFEDNGHCPLLQCQSAL